MYLNKSLKIEISGHTDNIGTNEYNRELSLKRAQEVVNYLIKTGVDSERMVARGYGEIKPIAPNNTEEGRATNRRTELKIIGF